MTAPSSKPLITLITVVRNGADFIERCLASVAAQTYDNIEYIVLDGASTDGTQAIVERYRPHISYTDSKPDKGAYDATAQGFARAKGEVIGLLHADDWLAPDAVQTLADMHIDNPQAEMFCFAMQEHRLLTNGIKPTRIFRDPPTERFGLVDGLYCHGVNRFYRRDVIQRHGRFLNDRYIQMADREMYVRMGWEGLRKATIDKILYHFLVHPHSNSAGADIGKKIYMLNETARIAADWLRDPPPSLGPARGLSSEALAKEDGGLSPEERSLLQDWYCFNTLRAVWFTLKAGHTGEALHCALALLRRYPLRTLKNLIFYKMPKAYRPT